MLVLSDWSEWLCCASLHFDFSVYVFSCYLLVAYCADFTKIFFSVVNSSRWILINSSLRAKASWCSTIFVAILSTRSDLSLSISSLYFVLHATRLSMWTNISFSSVENDSSFAATYFSSKSESRTLAFSAFYFSINMSSLTDWSNASFSIFSCKNSFFSLSNTDISSFRCSLSIASTLLSPSLFSFDAASCF